VLGFVPQPNLPELSHFEYNNENMTKREKLCLPIQPRQDGKAKLYQVQQFIIYQEAEE
jgi:hypothetical protein